MDLKRDDRVQFSIALNIASGELNKRPELVLASLVESSFFAHQICHVRPTRDPPLPRLCVSCETMEGFGEAGWPESATLRSVW